MTAFPSRQGTFCVRFHPARKHWQWFDTSDDTWNRCREPDSQHDGLELSFENTKDEQEYRMDYPHAPK